MNRMLSLSLASSLLLAANVTFAEQIDLNTAAMDAELAASLEQQVATKVDRLNNVNRGEVTIVEYRINRETGTQEPVYQWQTEQSASL